MYGIGWVCRFEVLVIKLFVSGEGLDNADAEHVVYSLGRMYM
jgi:hypothetical protein